MSPGTQLVLIRHGETEWTERNRLHGRLDSPLSATGTRHSELTAQRLRGERFDALYSSPQGRAMQTAAIVREAVGLTPVPLDGFREGDFGWIEGWPVARMGAHSPEPKILKQFVMWLWRMTAERPDQVSSRLSAAVNMLVERHPQGRLLVVTHFFALSIFMAYLVKREPDSWQNYSHWTACGISEFHLVDGRWQIIYLNDDHHLQEERQP